MWAHGPFPCGSYTVLRIFRMGLRRQLLPGEKVIAAQGHSDVQFSRSQVTNGIANFGFIRSRHKATNKRLEQFKVLSNRFRYKLDLDSNCLFAITNLVQLCIEDEEPV